MSWFRKPHNHHMFEGTSRELLLCHLIGGFFLDMMLLKNSSVIRSGRGRGKKEKKS